MLIRFVKFNAVESNVFLYFPYRLFLARNKGF